jgi:hypothetical protein
MGGAGTGVGARKSKNLLLRGELHENRWRSQTIFMINGDEKVVLGGVDAALCRAIFRAAAGRPYTDAA